MGRLCWDGQTLLRWVDFADEWIGCLGNILLLALRAFAKLLNEFVFRYRRLGRESAPALPPAPGNRFASFVRTRGLVVRWDWAWNVMLCPFPFSLFAPRGFPFAFSAPGSFLFSLQVRSSESSVWSPSLSQKDQVKWSEIKWNQIKSSESKCNQMESNEFKWNQMESS